ncbi:MAG: hypothetical protein RR832_05820 [Bacilli bacterium]
MIKELLQYLKNGDYDVNEKGGQIFISNKYNMKVAIIINKYDLIMGINNYQKKQYH